MFNVHLQTGSVLSEVQGNDIIKLLLQRYYTFMLKNRRGWIFYLTILLFTQAAIAQDIEFSQFLYNPVYLNQGMYGINGGPRIIANYRNQWPTLQKAFESYSISYDQHFDKIGGGIGIQILSDNQASGIIKTTALSAGYNHLFKINDKTGIRAGMSAMVFQKRLEWSKLLFYDQFDQSTALPTSSISFEQIPDINNHTLLDIGAGFILFNKNTYGGLSVKHLNQPNESYYKSYKSNLPLRLSANFGTQIRTKRGKSTYISPNIMFTSQARFKQIQGHVLLNASPVILGMGYRHAFENIDAFIFYAGVQKGIVRVVYSYDNTLNNLRSKSGGAHELSLTLNFSDGKKAAAKRTLKNSLDCPGLL